MPTTRSIVLAGLFTASLAQAASADFVSWTGAAGDFNWSNAANWSTAQVPTGSDSVLIAGGTPGSIEITGFNANCDTLISSHPIHLNNAANLSVFTSASFNGGLSLFGSSFVPHLKNFGTISITNSAALFNGAIDQYGTNSTTTIAPGCTVTIWDGGLGGAGVLGGYLLNNGVIQLEAGLTIGKPQAGGAPTVFINQAGGLIQGNVSAAGVYHNSGPSSTFINYGACYFNAGGALGTSVKSYNVGSLVNLGGNLNIADLESLTPSGTLLEGNYEVRNGSTISTSGTDITTISAGASVTIDNVSRQGVSGSMSGLARAENIYGTLEVRGGASFTLAPYIFGTVKNHGLVTVGAGSMITVFGGYLCGADGTHIIVENQSPSGVGVFQTYLGMSLHGTLQVDFFDDQLLSIPGSSFVMANLFDPQSGAIDGQFDTVTVFGASGAPSHIEYSSSNVKLVGGLGCDGDLNSDGAVNGADLATLLGSWGGTGGADLDQNGVVDAADLAILLGAWGTCS
ncbi:MAG: dockerin type I repeat-containing protein [Phycisphaerae bacterium]|nr:dockerin type I repeat-containing protein [Phycisphaerae bacterium]